MTTNKGLTFLLLKVFRRKPHSKDFDRNSGHKPSTKYPWSFPEKPEPGNKPREIFWKSLICFSWSLRSNIRTKFRAIFVQMFEQFFGQSFDQTFGQIFGQGFGDRKCSVQCYRDEEIWCKVLIGRRDADLHFYRAGEIQFCSSMRAQHAVLRLGWY